MKKIAHFKEFTTFIFDSTDYIKIEKNGQRIDDKYVDDSGDKINSYRRTLKKGQLIIRHLYWIEFQNYFYLIRFKNFRNYLHCELDESNKINKILNTKNSYFDYDSIDNFDTVKTRIIRIFSDEMRLRIK